MAKAEDLYVRRTSFIHISGDQTLREEGAERGTDSQTVLEEIIENGIKALKEKHRRKRRKKSS
jgi:hypothetical protein